MSINKTFHGYIETTKDALLLFEACRRGILPRVNRRLQDKERYLIESGTIFCFDENESGIKRWTDGLVWSPSRILGNFLVYRELEDKKVMTRSYSTDVDYFMEEDDEDTIKSRRSASFSSSSTSSNDSNLTKKREKAIVGSLKNSYRFKRNGLIKKSISLIVDGVQQHLISYYHKDDVLFQRLNTPSNVQNLSSLEVSPGLKLRQNFRIPLFLSDDGSDDGYNYYGYQNNKSVKRKYSEFIHQQQTPSKSPSSLVTSPASSSAPTPPDLIKNYSASQEDEAPMTFKKKDANTYQSVTRMSDSTTMVQSSSFPPLNVYNNDMFHTGTNHSNNYNTAADNYTSLERQKQQLLQEQKQQQLLQEQQQRQQQQQQKLLLEQKQRQQQESRQREHQQRLQKQQQQEHQQELQLQSHHHTDNTKRPSSYGTSFRHCSSQDMRALSLFDQQNPHQHLFSSSSFHTINHASINQRIDPIANAFMIDIDALLGTGWNEFELQL